MNIGQEIRRQRVKHIVSSYQLDGGETELFNQYLDHLLALYAPALIELALVETLIDGWLQVPLLRGCEFLTKVEARINDWKTEAIVTTLTSQQFQQITGLDPTSIFGSPSSTVSPIS